MTKTIFITGASKGFGKIWTTAFLNAGYNVAATARNVETLDDLKKEFGSKILPIKLDVNDREQCFKAVQTASAHFGSIDIVINNAGFGLFGTIEETTEKEARDQIETNVFGLLWVTQAVMPIMRKQQHGHIIQISSVLGMVTLPVLGIYNASKWAVEGLSETLAAEVAGFGIKVTLVEPNGFATEWASASALHAQPMKEYDNVRASFNEGLTDDIFGVPEATTEAMLKLVRSENPPLRLFLGKMALPWVTQVYADRLKTWESWKEVAEKAHGK
ncbi:SDR family NAD(P)-dependent oxidoreductase [Pseudochryseolinea flava]|uniref:Short-chain dehydrogenase/reductase n=1 Tax=Pseudochryseolinea flava TaxID=2059302 RepID=A0A364Y374_9BACT|nr:SDR family NAD(P)-dependent oxidoreductase [Pseudochryseolinea flava]RAW00596.1 short-chain dehydrogenase/reductase [Pseudochryseolinea flava]